RADGCHYTLCEICELRRRSRNTPLQVVKRNLRSSWCVSLSHLSIDFFSEVCRSDSSDECNSFFRVLEQRENSLVVSRSLSELSPDFFVLDEPLSVFTTNAVRHLHE